MKKLIYVFLLSILFVSCATQKIMVIHNAQYDTMLRVYDVTVVSRLTDFYKVYKINNTDFAFLPYASLMSEANIDDLEKAIILSAEEAQKFKNDLKEFVQRCESNKTGLIFAEIELKESDIKQSPDAAAEEAPSVPAKPAASASIPKTVFLIQAATRTHMSNKQLELTASSKYSASPYSLKIEDVKKLISALEK